MSRLPFKRLGLLLLLALAQAATGRAWAEPYLAVKEGLPCGACHVNPTGGGLRTSFGDVYSQTQMPQQQIDTGNRGLWLGNIGDWFRAGGNFRDDFTWVDAPHQKKSDSAGIDDFRLYGAANLIQDRLTLYLDERIAPGGAEAREAYALLWSGSHEFYLKAGQFYLPFGLRLQDDETFVRQASQVNYTTPDNGAELGWIKGSWNAQLALSNGAAGGNETNQGKQVTGSLVYVRPGWRFGGSYSDNEATIGRRQMGALFAGLRTGPIAWLAEADYIEDTSLQPRVGEYAGLLEANWAFMRGHNLKLGAEYLDPQTHVSHDGRNRFSVVWEYTPIQFVQTRLGVRDYNGIPQNDLQNQRQAFAELHIFF